MHDNGEMDTAVKLFGQGFNCAQALLAAYGGPLGLQRKVALRLGLALGGGLAGTAQVCGAVTAAAMVLGLRYGSDDAKKVLVSRAEAEKKTVEFMEAFKQRHGSLVCADLLGRTGRIRAGLLCLVGRRDKQCVGFVRDAAEILGGML